MFTLMKKLAAILLLLIFMFNLFGYRLFVSCMVNHANQTLETALDKNNFNEEDLISIKTPINLPYYNNSSVFSRAYGEVEMNGILYTYVKSRIYNDSLEMLCIPNKSKQQLLHSKDNFTNVVFDLQKDINKKPSGSGKTFSFVKLLGEYETNAAWSLDINCLQTSSNNNAYYNAGSGLLHKATVEQPPDGISNLV
jgi:hypothetical protein